MLYYKLKKNTLAYKSVKEIFLLSKYMRVVFTSWDILFGKEKIKY